MGDNRNRWGWLYYVYCLLTVLHTTKAEEGAREKQLAEDAFQKAINTLGNPRNLSSDGLLMSSVVTSFYIWSTDYKKGKVYQKILPNDPNAVKKLYLWAQKTFIIFHGFRGDGLEDWIQNLKDKLLHGGNCNVISVDWPAGTAWWLFYYYNAVANAPYVGSDTAALLKHLDMYKGLDMNSVHLVGHNLGAHAAGFCGKVTSKIMDKKIGRISGVEPAGLMFRAKPNNSRLDKSDASYVDIIHTNSCDPGMGPWTSCFGLNENIGHADFWPNGGEYQPFCRKAKMRVFTQRSDNHTSNHKALQSTSQRYHNFTEMGDKIQGGMECDHEMAYTYFIESINYSTNDTYFLARPCNSWPLYIDGLCPCGDHAQYMGYNSFKGVNGVFYLKTNGSSPFAVRDAVCPPAGSHNQNSIILILSSTSAAILSALLIGTAVYCIVKKSRRREESQSGLVVETDFLCPPDIC